MLEPCDAKVSRTVPRGLDDRKVVRLLGTSEFRLRVAQRNYEGLSLRVAPGVLRE